MDTSYARSQPTNMLEERTDWPRHGVQHISLFQPHSRQAGTQGDHKGQWLRQDTQEAIGAAQRPQSVQATQRLKEISRSHRKNWAQYRIQTAGWWWYFKITCMHSRFLSVLCYHRHNTVRNSAGQYKTVQLLVIWLPYWIDKIYHIKITYMLIKQQQLSLLPPKRVTRLFYLQQYTKGQARQLVRSCQHMDGNQGYPRAKCLLREHFGNEYKISTAYTEKALYWPTIKSEDLNP